MDIAHPPRLEKLRVAIASIIPCEPENARVDLHQQSLRELLGRYINWRDRFIRPAQRKVLFARQFWNTKSATDHLQGVLALQRSIEAGEDLARHLSQKIHRYGYVRSKATKLGRRRGIEWGDKDFALNSFEAHHLHLGTAMGGHRTDMLLFTLFDRFSALFVMVGNHKSFEDGSLQDAVARARAEFGDTVKGVLAASPSRSREERMSLQRRGLNVIVPVEDEFVFSGFLSSVGTSASHTIYADRLSDFLRTMDPRIDDQEAVSRLFKEAGRSPPSEMDCEWMLHYCDLGLLENVSRTFFSMVKWRR